MDAAQRFSSRKFGLTVAVMLTATALVYAGLISELIWRDTIIAVGASYFTANVFSAKTVK